MPWWVHDVGQRLLLADTERRKGIGGERRRRMQEARRLEKLGRGEQSAGSRLDRGHSLRQCHRPMILPFTGL